MALKSAYWYILFATAVIQSCTTVQHVSKTEVSYTIIRSSSPDKTDEEIEQIILPYKSQLDSVMNEVIAVIPAEMQKQKPESPLGNWVADVVTERLRNDGYQVDLAVINYGGLRVPYLAQGPLTVGEIFELAPFDNMLVIVDMPGMKLDSFFLLIAEHGGWPISKDVKLTIGDKKLLNAQVNGQPIDPAEVYKVATVDYVATGGDNMKIMIPLLREQTGLLFRDVLIDHVRMATASGQTISSSVDGRIIKRE